MVQGKMMFNGKKIKRMDFEKWRFKHANCQVGIFTAKDGEKWTRLYHCQKCGECYVEGKGGYVRGSKFKN